MTDTSSSSFTKKCPHCQEWSAWNQRPNDRCEHCGEFLDPRAQKRLEEQQQKAKQPDQPTFFEIQPDDNVVVRFFKRMGRVGQVVFGAILAFFIAVVTFAAG
ncbi:hypothetical protein MUN82_04470 [Hymenobacter aerilatus]|uniref:TFIIB-type zinc ribbon-containing protein n=1 Tax=Hymenobacter aerilatus TaxID=2932251 RepID=A0A8T9SVY6_9BACT|nr:hypothetical protein [Hymenobacter aerilatus]UOR06352.1 hypothetical protein MUN82_04470 [Hymenobacter aerilatus]